MTKRVTVPDGHCALIVPNQQADEFLALGVKLRGSGRIILEAPEREVAGDLILAVVAARGYGLPSQESVA